MRSLQREMSQVRLMNGVRFDVEGRLGLGCVLLGGPHCCAWLKGQGATGRKHTVILGTHDVTRAQLPCSPATWATPAALATTANTCVGEG